jgi:hypothetical protein
MKLIAILKLGNERGPVAALFHRSRTQADASYTASSLQIDVNSIVIIKELVDRIFNARWEP